MNLNTRIRYMAHGKWHRENALLSDSISDDQKRVIKGELARIHRDAKKYDIEKEVFDLAYEFEMLYNDKIIRDANAYLAKHR